MSESNHTFLIIMVPMAALLSAGAAVQNTFVGDFYIANAFQKVTASPWEETMELVTFIGRPLVMIAMALPLLAWFVFQRRRAEAYAISVALASFGITPVIKIIVERPRPTSDLVTVWQNFDGLSFPSGHAFDAIVLFGLLCYLTPMLVPWKAAVHAIRLSTVTLIVLIGSSRVYLGAHWPSDVVGGFLFGAISLTLLIHFHRLLAGTDEVDRRVDAAVPA